jgi:hypothetical protein
MRSTSACLTSNSTPRQFRRGARGLI